MFGVNALGGGGGGGGGGERERERVNHIASYIYLYLVINLVKFTSIQNSLACIIANTYDVLYSLSSFHS